MLLDIVRLLGCVFLSLGGSLILIAKVSGSIRFKHSKFFLRKIVFVAIGSNFWLCQRYLNNFPEFLKLFWRVVGKSYLVMKFQTLLKYLTISLYHIVIIFFVLIYLCGSPFISSIFSHLACFLYFRSSLNIRPNILIFWYFL